MRDIYLQEDLKKEIIEGDGTFDSKYLDDIDDDDDNDGVAANQGITPTEEEDGDMLASE